MVTAVTQQEASARRLHLQTASHLRAQTRCTDWNIENLCSNCSLSEKQQSATFVFDWSWNTVLHPSGKYKSFKSSYTFLPPGEISQKLSALHHTSPTFDQSFMHSNRNAAFMCFLSTRVLFLLAACRRHNVGQLTTATSSITALQAQLTDTKLATHLIQLIVHRAHWKT